MSFHTSTPSDLTHKPPLYQVDSFNDDLLFDQYLNLDDSSILAVAPRSPQLVTAPSPSHHFSQADSDIGYWSNGSNNSRPQSPVGRGRSKTFSDHQLLRTRQRADSELFGHKGVADQSPAVYTLDSSPPSPTLNNPAASPPHVVQSLRRKKSSNNRHVSSFRSAREPSRERETHRITRSASRSAIRKMSSTPKMLKTSLNAYANSIEEWNAKLAQQASQFNFDFQTSSAPPISPPPSARVSDASWSESSKTRTKASAQPRKQKQQQQQYHQTEQWQHQTQQHAVMKNAHILTPLTTPKYNDVSIENNNQATFATQSQQWATTGLNDTNGSCVDVSLAVDGGEHWWDEPAELFDPETSPVVLSHNESFPQPMATSPITSRNMNAKSLQIALPPAEQRHEWPTINTDVSTDVDADLTISPGVRPTPIALTSANHFGYGHAHTQSLPNTGNSMLLQPHISVPSSPTRIVKTPNGGKPSPLRHRESGSYFSNIARRPVPAYLQSQQASPMLSQHGSPMRSSKVRQRHLENDDYSSPPSRSVSPPSFSQSLSQSFPYSLGIMGLNNASTPNFFQPHSHPYPLQVRKPRTLSHKQYEPSFTSHHRRGRSSMGYPRLPPSHSQSFPDPSGSPSPRQHAQTRAKMHIHQRSKSSSNLHSSSAKRASSTSKKGESGTGAGPVSMDIEFHNFTPRDGSRILSGVAPSGSNKTKARREKEAREKQRRLSQIKVKAVRDLGGDPASYLGDGLDVGSDTGMDGGSGDDLAMDGLEMEVKNEVFVM